jgi:hypothetical protein
MQPQLPRRRRPRGVDVLEHIAGSMQAGRRPFVHHGSESLTGEAPSEEADAVEVADVPVGVGNDAYLASASIRAQIL